MRVLLLMTVFIFLISGCGNNGESQTERDARIAKEAKAELLAQLKAQQEEKERERKEREKNSTLFKAGIYKEGDKITIDTNKTRHFFKNLSKKITQQMDQFSNEMEEGIEVDENHIQIDLNKTDHFLDKWHQKMQNFADEINALSNSLEQNTTKP